MRPVITPFALVAIAVRVGVDAAAGPLVAPPLPLVAGAARPRVHALALLHSLTPLALVAIAVGEGIDARAVLVPIMVFALVAIAVGPGADSLAVRRSLPPLSLVAVALGRGGHPPTVAVVVLPLALVALPVGGGEEALAVPLPPAHLSHILGEDAVVEPLHGAAAERAAVEATASAPCYNFPRRGPLIPDPAAGPGVD